MPNLKTVLANDLLDWYYKTQGNMALIGTNGGLSSITGEITEMDVIPNGLSVTTEHGDLLLDGQEEIKIAIDIPE